MNVSKTRWPSRRSSCGRPRSSARWALPATMTRSAWEASALTLNFIDIEPGGRGFARPGDRKGPSMSEIFKRPEIKNVDFCVDENIGSTTSSFRI